MALTQKVLFTYTLTNSVADAYAAPAAGAFSEATVIYNGDTIDQTVEVWLFKAAGPAFLWDKATLPAGGRGVVDPPIGGLATGDKIQMKTTSGSAVTAIGTGAEG